MFIADYVCLIYITYWGLFNANFIQPIISIKKNSIKSLQTNSLAYFPVMVFSELRFIDRPGCQAGNVGIYNHCKFTTRPFVEIEKPTKIKNNIQKTFEDAFPPFRPSVLSTRAGLSMLSSAHKVCDSKPIEELTKVNNDWMVVIGFQRYYGFHLNLPSSHV